MQRGSRHQHAPALVVPPSHVQRYTCCAKSTGSRHAPYSARVTQQQPGCHWHKQMVKYYAHWLISAQLVQQLQYHANPALLLLLMCTLQSRPDITPIQLHCGCTAAQPGHQLCTPSGGHTENDASVHVAVSVACMWVGCTDPWQCHTTALSTTSIV